MSSLSVVGISMLNVRSNRDGPRDNPFEIYRFRGGFRAQPIGFAEEILAALRHVQSVIVATYSYRQGKSTAASGTLLAAVLCFLKLAAFIEKALFGRNCHHWAATSFKLSL